MRYYQFGGFQSWLSLTEIHDSILARISFSDATQSSHDSSISLVLGIKPNGASYLLLPYTRGWRPPRFKIWSSEDFASLSPISFRDRNELSEKLKTYVSNKKDKSGPRDRSKANTSYTVSGEDPSDTGMARASFEQSRVLLKLLRSDLTSKQRQELSISVNLESNKFRLISLTFNTWTADTRPLQEREDDPKILDIAWSEFSLGANSLNPIRTQYFVTKENRYLSNPGRKRLDFQDGTTGVTELPAMREKIQQALSQNEDMSMHVTLLLIHDERQTMQILRAIGVDTSRWTSGVADFLYDHRRESRNDSSSRRSRSPPLHRVPQSRSRSTSHYSAIKRIHIIDVQQLCMILQQVRRKQGILSNAEDLGVNPPQPVSGWCAGNESRLLGLMWYSMATGMPIDEQQAFRWPKIRPNMQDQTPAAVEHGRDDDSDEDIDPNDMFQDAGPGPATEASVKSKSGNLSIMDPDGWDDESDDDF